MRIGRWTSVGVMCLAAVATGVAAAAEGEPVLDRCLVSLEEEAKVPAREAGVLWELLVREGDLVSKGDVIAKIDDNQPQMEKRKAAAEHAQAVAKAASDVDVRYSQKAQAVAGKASEKAEQSHKSVPGSVTDVERDRLRLEWEKSGLQIEQAELERRLNGLTAESKKVEVDAADNGIERRLIKAPLDGIVVEVFPHQGEWMQPGDPLARVVRTDKLRVMGFVDASKWGPDKVRNRPVTVAVTLDDGPQEFAGRIIFVSPLVESGDFRVFAEVENRQADGEWLLQAGQTVTMTIHSKQAPLPPASR